jgi:hypothetical protein
MTLYFIDKDEYPLLLKELPYARGETIGYNDTYYFVLYIHEDKIEEFVELTPRVDKETVLEYFIHTGFSISPTKEVPTLIKSPERTGNQLLYRDEEH